MSPGICMPAPPSAAQSVSVPALGGEGAPHAGMGALVLRVTKQGRADVAEAGPVMGSAAGCRRWEEQPGGGPAGTPPARWSCTTSRPATRPLLLAVMPSAERGTCSMPTASWIASPTSRGERKTCRCRKMGRDWRHGAAFNLCSQAPALRPHHWPTPRSQTGRHMPALPHLESLEAVPQLPLGGLQPRQQHLVHRLQQHPQARHRLGALRVPPHQRPALRQLLHAQHVRPAADLPLLILPARRTLSQRSVAGVALHRLNVGQLPLAQLADKPEGGALDAAHHLLRRRVHVQPRVAATALPRLVCLLQGCPILLPLRLASQPGSRALVPEYVGQQLVGHCEVSLVMSISSVEGQQPVPEQQGQLHSLSSSGVDSNL